MKFNKTLSIILALSLFASTVTPTLAITDVINDTNTKAKKTKTVKKKKGKLSPVEQLEQQAQTEFTNEVHSVFTLKDCVEIAVKYNPSIQALIYNEDVYKSKIGQAWSNFFPRISVGIEGSRSNTRYSPTSPYMRNITQTFGYIPSISADMMIFDFGKTKATADMAKRTYEAKQEDTKEGINTVVYNIKSTYYNILFAQAQVHVYEDTVKDYELQLKQAWGFYNLGKKAKIDVVTADYNLGKAKLNLVKAKNTLEVARVQLSKIMGIPEYTNYELSDQLSLQNYEETIENLVDTAFSVRPELIAAQKSMNAAKMNLRAKRRDYAPNLGIFAGYDNGIGTEYNMSSAQFGVGLNYNALNMMKVKKQIDEAKATYKMAQAEYAAVKDDVYLNVKKSYIDLQTDKEAIVIAKLSLDQAKEQYRQVTGRYKAGIGDAIELKDGENTYLNARLDFYNAMLNYNVALANLEKEIGVPLTLSDSKILEITKTDY